mgnify:CR=1 FL=1
MEVRIFSDSWMNIALEDSISFSVVTYPWSEFGISLSKDLPLDIRNRATIIQKFDKLFAVVLSGHEWMECNTSKNLLEEPNSTAILKAIVSSLIPHLWELLYTVHEF